jgi:hypothetical protein
MGLFGGSAALATVTTYTSSAAFLAAAPGASDDYGSYTAGQKVASGSTLGGLTYTFNTAAHRGGIITDVYNSFSGLSLAAKEAPGNKLDDLDFFYAGDSVTITFATPLKAIGIFANIYLAPTETLKLTTAAGIATDAVTAYDTKTFGFVGLVSSTPFSSVTFTSDGSFNIPKILFSTFSAAPETSTWLMMLAGLFAAGVALRRRTASL